jgi:hypothetical protein
MLALIQKLKVKETNMNRTNTKLVLLGGLEMNGRMENT